MTPRILTRKAAKAARTVLQVATAKPTAKRGAASNARLGASFEDEVDRVLSVHGHVARGHPASKVVRGANGPRTVYTAKNGVDFVGVYAGYPIAAECKRLPGAASLSGAKDDSTRWEAAWLARFRAQGGRGGFLVHDPDLLRIYVVAGRHDLERLALGGFVSLRERDGVANALCFDENELSRAIRWLATGTGTFP